MHDKWYTCQLFFSKMCEIFRLHRTGFSKDLLMASEDCWRFWKTFYLKIHLTKDVDRNILDYFKTGPTIPKDFQPISSIIKEFRWCSDDFLNVKKKDWILFHRFLSNLHSLLSVRCEKLVWMCEITILDLRAWDSRIMHESWQV